MHVCGRYFYIPARNEHRGVGGIFYDDLSSAEAGFDVLSFTKEVGDWVGVSLTLITLLCVDLSLFATMIRTFLSENLDTFAT